MNAELGDDILMARSRAGDTEAFRQLFERKHRRVYLIAYQIVGEQTLAEDVAQEVFLKLWQHCADYDASLPLDPWLRRITTNRAIDHWRARGPERRQRLEPSAGGDPDTFLETAHSRAAGMAGGAFDPQARIGWRQLQAIWDELADGLPPQQRAAFVLRHIEGADAQEVAETLGCSASTVRSHIAEARRALRESIRARYPELLGDADR